MGLLLVVVVDEFVGDRVQVSFEGRRERWGSTDGPEVVQSDVGVVAADDGRCSEIGVGALRAGGHAVDAAVATALCLGVVHPVSSGLGGGAFMIVRSSDSGKAEAFDSRETAPSAASKVASWPQTLVSHVLCCFSLPHFAPRYFYLRAGLALCQEAIWLELIRSRVPY